MELKLHKPSTLEKIKEYIPFYSSKIDLSGFEIRYKGRGYNDRGVSMERVVTERTPVAVLNRTTLEQFEFETGTVRKLDGTALVLEGRLISTYVHGELASDFHRVFAKTPREVLEYLVQIEPELVSPELEDFLN